MSRPTKLAVRALATAVALPRASPALRCPKCSTRHPSSIPTRRDLSTTTTSAGVKSWFTPRSARPAPNDAHAQFLTALKTLSINPLRDAYDALIAQRTADRKAPITLEQGELMSAMTFLSMRPEFTALSLLKRMYADLGQWGFEMSAKHPRAVLRGMCSVGQIAEAIAWMEQIQGSTDDWRVVLRGAVRHETGLVLAVEEKLRAQAEVEGVKLGPEDYTLLLRHLRFEQSEEKETMRRLRQLLAETKEKGVWIREEGEVELVGIHLRLGDIARAGNIVEGWELRKDPLLWNTMLDWRIARNEGKNVEEALVTMRELGLEPYAKAVGHLVLRHLRKDASDIINTVDDIEREYGAKVSSATWAEVLELVEDLDKRVAVYEEVRARGVQIDSHIAKSLIFPLCALDPPNLRGALDVYADLTSRSIVVSASTVRGRILAIYSTLFRAYSAVSATADEKIPITLLKDMRRFGLALPTPALTSLVIALIRSSPDHYGAFNNYAHLYALDPSLITEKSYTAIITAFIAHSTPSSPFAPPGYIVEMLKDMRKAGYPPSPHILTTLLSNYGAQAGKSRKSSTDPVYRQTKLDGIHKAISEIHNMLKLESLVTPDIPLCNALMEAYSRIGAYSASFEVWDILVEMRPHVPKAEAREAYGPSISIILDTCGRSGQLVRARRIWAWARKHQLVEEDGKGKAWEGWVECLCRLKQLEEAAELVLQEANLEMVRILHKFSWQTKVLYRSLPGKLRERYPEYWEVVKGETKRGKGREDDGEGEREGVSL